MDANIQIKEKKNPSEIQFNSVYYIKTSLNNSFMKKILIWQLDKKISHQKHKYICMEITVYNYNIWVLRILMK